MRDMMGVPHRDVAEITRDTVKDKTGKEIPNPPLPEQRIKQTRADEMKARRLTVGDLQMPFYYTVSGDKPKNGRGLYISLHGGGGAPKQVNDGQWENQKRLYRVPEGVYLAPRAPTNTWNLWHEGHIDGMFDRLIILGLLGQRFEPATAGGKDGDTIRVFAGEPGLEQPRRIFWRQFAVTRGGIQCFRFSGVWRVVFGNRGGFGQPRIDLGLALHGLGGVVQEFVAWGELGLLCVMEYASATSSRSSQSTNHAASSGLLNYLAIRVRGFICMRFER